MATDNERRENLYRRLYIAGIDVGEAWQHAERLLKKGWHHHPWERRQSVYMQQVAFTTALVVAYCRAFTHSDGWPDIPRRLVPYDEDEWALHERLLKMRNTIYAHSDSEAFSIELQYPERGWPRSIDRLPSLRLSAEDTASFMTMTAKLSKALAERRRALYEELKTQKTPGGSQLLH